MTAEQVQKGWVMCRFEPERNQWLPIKAMNSCRSSVKAATDGQLIYVVGGYDGEHYLTTAEVFDHREGRCVSGCSFACNISCLHTEASTYVTISACMPQG